MRRWLKPFLAVSMLLAFSVLIRFQPWIVGVITFCASMFVFGKIERDRNIHDISFYADGKPSISDRMFVSAYSNVETLIRSLVLGILPVFLFSGTRAHRIALVAAIFVGCVIAGYLILLAIQARTRFNAERWAYVRISVLLGIAFSLLVSGIPAQTLTETVTLTAKSKWGALNFNEFVELIHGMIFQVNDFLSDTLINKFGVVVGRILSIVISLNVAYGFVISLYSLLLLRFLGNSTRSA